MYCIVVYHSILMEYSGQSPNATLLILYSLPITAVTGQYLTDFRICEIASTNILDKNHDIGETR